MSQGRESDETVGEVTIDGPIRSLPITRTGEQFEIRVEGDVAVMTYRVNGSAVSLLHTEVPVALRGQGLGEALAQAALEDTRRRGLTVRPYCPFVARYIERHSEFLPLVDPGFSKDR